MSQLRKIELLAPARTADIGHQAILHGADAVYIGAPAFGARAAAANSVDDIARLCEFAHLYNAKIYVTLNTILYDDEIESVRNLIRQLYDIGVDALIVQDMALLEMDIPPIVLHASTQMDIRTPERATFLEKAGFKQIVLARELGLSQIKKIRNHTTVALEAFVHGALCVSYSGQCYASQLCMGRSANRGECAQFCRLPFDLIDANGKVVLHDKHLLSLRDMNRSASLESMLDAGISSFKIEGRLKDVTYVKNVTAFYRQTLDEIIARRPQEFQRASAGKSEISFTPRPEKSFNRGFTDYFLNGRSAIHQFFTPKSLGERLGNIVSLDRECFTIDTQAPLAAGDGLCYFDSEGRLQGIRANRVEEGKVFPAPKMPRISVGTEVWRNHDHAFYAQLQRATAQRRLEAVISLRQQEGGYILSLKDEMGTTTEEYFPAEITTAQKSQHDNLVRILSKTGDTPIKIVRVEIKTGYEPFIPSSTLTEWRRRVVARHLSELAKPQPREATPRPNAKNLVRQAESTFSEPHHQLNVSNHLSKKTYQCLGIDVSQPAVEISLPREPFAMMTCKHCLLYAMGSCKRESKAKFTEPLSLRLSDGRTFPLRFDCSRCEMQVMSK